MKASAEKIQERKRVMIMKKKEQNLDRFQFSTSCRNAIIQHEKHYTIIPAKDWNEAKHIFSQGTKYFNLGLQLFSFEEELVQRVRVNQLLSKLYKQLAAFKQEKIANNDALDRVSKIQWRRIKCLELSLGFCDPEAKDHPKFDSVRATPVVLYSACAQMDGKPAYKTTIGEAVEGQEVFYTSPFI